MEQVMHYLVELCLIDHEFCSFVRKSFMQFESQMSVLCLLFEVVIQHLHTAVYIHQRLVQTQFFGLDGGHVNHIGDDGKKILSAFNNGVGKAFYFVGSEVGIVEKAGKTHNGIHGGAYFVREIVQKGRFEPIALFGFLFGCNKAVEEPFPIGHILHGENVVGEFSTRIHQRID